MHAMAADWSADRRLDILVLGPMGEDEAGPTSTLPIRDALVALLAEDEARALLDRKWENVQATGADIVATGNPGCSICWRVLARPPGKPLI